MSREELAVLARSLAGADLHSRSPHAATPRAAGRPLDARKTTLGTTTLGTRLGTTGLVVLLVLGLGLGFAAGQVTGIGTGTARAEQATADRLSAARLAATRVMIWADGATVPGEDVEAPPLSVTLVAAGGDVVLERLAIGGAAVAPDSPLTLRAGVRVDAELRLVAGCPDGVVPTGAPGRAGPGEQGFPAHAVVRLAVEPETPGGRDPSEVAGGSDGAGGATARDTAEHDVPLDVLGDPSGVLLPLLARCAPGGRIGRAGPPGPASR